MRVGDFIRCRKWNGISFAVGEVCEVVLVEESGGVRLKNHDPDYIASFLLENFELVTPASPCDAGAEEYDEIMKDMEALND